MLVFDWKIEKGRRFRWAGCTPLKPAGRRRAFKPKKKGLNIIMKAKKTAKRKFTKRTAAAIMIAHAGYSGLHWFGIGGGRVVEPYHQLLRDRQYVI